MSGYAIFPIRKGRQWAVRHQSKIIGIYSSHHEAHLVAERDERRQKMTLKVNVKYEFSGTIEFDDDMLSELKDKLVEDGVEGIPDTEELMDAIREMASDNPENILPEGHQLANEMEFVSVEGELPEIPAEDDPDDGANKADSDHKRNKEGP